jgi:sterol desaturase/sphingolipid hydroxylase (fatty acid hydroxylase superfamily)
MLDELIRTASGAFGQAQQWLFEQAVQPVMFAVGLSNHLETAFDGTGWLLVGLVQIAIMVVVFGSLQRLWPAEIHLGSGPERAAVRTDVIYTLIHKLGLVRIALFFSVDPLFDLLFGKLRLWGLDGWQIDTLWPGATDLAWVSFVIYLLVFDFVDYLLHRGQHRFAWWWNLHALHHSQQRMTMWSDNRNHLLDDLIRSSVMVAVAQLIGVGPGQFVAIVALTQLLESLSHANVRMSFGRWGERILVSPRFHRLHHSIGLGHESSGPGSLGGHNFAVLFPVWDVLLGTANFENRYDPTGIRDQLPGGADRSAHHARAPDGGRDYGSGFWVQQWLGLKRLAGAA